MPRRADYAEQTKHCKFWPMCSYRPCNTVERVGVRGQANQHRVKTVFPSSTLHTMWKPRIAGLPEIHRVATIR
jgi:hypothetical protein